MWCIKSNFANPRYSKIFRFFDVQSVKKHKLIHLNPFFLTKNSISRKNPILKINWGSHLFFLFTGRVKGFLRLTTIFLCCIYCIIYLLSKPVDIFIINKEAKKLCTFEKFSIIQKWWLPQLWIFSNKIFKMGGLEKCFW